MTNKTEKLNSIPDLADMVQGGHCYQWDDAVEGWRLKAVRCDEHADIHGDPRCVWNDLRTGE
jgi:hypothetical protein